MLLYDISTDVLSAEVFEGDPNPKLEYIKSVKNGDDYNLSNLSTCMHTGTHIDSPYHFDEDGKRIEDLKLSIFYGKCTVVTIKGILTGEDMERLLPYCKRRLILHGEGEVYLSYSAAVVLADSDLVLIGTDGVSVSTAFDEYRTHMEFARAEIAVLEGLKLTGIPDGEYTLCAFPIKVGGAEASLCRAVLMEQEKGI